MLDDRTSGSGPFFIDVKDYVPYRVQVSKDFIEKKVNADSLAVAASQQADLSYFTISGLQGDVSQEYIQAWANRKYQSDDRFLNWVKSVFKTENFLSFFKYYRNPNASSKLINTKIKEPLSRVFFSEDSYFKYSIRNKDVESPQELNDGFDENLFESIIFHHNDIIVHDISESGPYRKFLSIDKVVAIEMDGNRISRLAYTAKREATYGYVYMDRERFIFYDKDYNEVTNEAHDLGRCPAVFVSNETIDRDPVIRQSMFTYLRSDMEEYIFLKTLQRMTEPNGAIPIVTKLKTKENRRDGTDGDGLPHEPMSPNMIGGQRSTERAALTGMGLVLQAGTVVEVPPQIKNDGAVDIDFAKSFLNFFYLPIEALEYLNRRIKEVEQNIIISIVGDYSEGNESAKNELQIAKSYVSKEDKLRWLSNIMSVARTESDNIMLSLKYGPGSVSVDAFYGSDFFLETDSDLYDLFNRSPNAIERKNILTKLARSRNRFNRTKSHKETILYKLIPYASDNDFKLALETVDPVTFQLQTRFNYWISFFEATYGSLTAFWDSSDASESEKLILINNLLTNLIQTHGKETGSTS